MKLKEDGGKVVVVSVVEDSPAYKAGLREGDVLAMLGKKKLKKPADFWDSVKGLKVGAIVEVTVDTEFGRDHTKIVLEKKSK